jgi:hypothetical protein
MNNHQEHERKNELDGKEVLLADALKKIVGRGMGTFLSCIPGKVA